MSFKKKKSNQLCLIKVQTNMKHFLFQLLCLGHLIDCNSQQIQIESPRLEEVVKIRKKCFISTIDYIKGLQKGGQGYMK